MSRTCPDCRYPMVVERHYDIELDLCRNCAGIWFDAGELRRLIDADPISPLILEEHLAPRVTQLRLQAGVSKCPCCDGLLHVYHYQYDSPIELHACHDCGGFWIQEGELQKIHHWREQHPSADNNADTSKPGRPKSSHIITDHERVLDRLELDRFESVRRFCSLLREHKPLWWSSRR